MFMFLILFYCKIVYGSQGVAKPGTCIIPFPWLPPMIPSYRTTEK